MLAPSLLSAETWDLAKDFRTDKNPNGPWFYGYSSYGGTTLTPLPAAKDILAVTGLNGWALEAGSFPFVAKNTTDAVIAGSGFEVSPGEVVLHPGNATAAADVVYLRWVAPSAGTYQVDAAFRRLDTGAKVGPFVIKQLGKPDQEILLGGKAIQEEGSLKFSDGMLVLAAQDTLDFAVSAWEDGPTHDAIGLSVRIAPTDPELLKPRMLLEYSFAADASDSSGQNLHGSLHGNPRFETVEGRAGVVLDGVGDWVEAAAKLPALGNEFTIECWVNPAAKQASYADIFGNQTSAGLGFVLQQNADKTNEYSFTYNNGAGGLISTKPVRLAADRWQHVAISKSPKELKFYLNGVLMDSVPAGAPVSASPLALRVGLGFEDEVRCFNGSLSGFRVWNRALSEIKPEVTPEQKFEAMASNSSVRLSTASPTRIFNSENPPVIDVSFGDGTVADGVIKTSFECVDLAGKTVAIAPGELSSKSGFKQTLRLSLPEGYYRLTSQPTIAGPAGDNTMAPATISFAVLGDAPVKSAPAPKTVIQGSLPTETLSLDGDQWKIATDPKNVGREEKWFNAPTADAKPTKVPWIIQDIFPGYHGLAWYWREFSAPKNPHEQGRFILRFLSVDYLAEVWVNGVKVGQHEGAEAPFEFDVTDSIQPGGKNLLAVRVLNPTVEPIDGIGLGFTARGIKGYPVAPGSVYNVGGIVDSVDLLATPAVRVENIFAKPDWKTGQLSLDINLRNAAKKSIAGSIRVSVAPATNGETLDAILLTPDLPPGDTLVRASLQVPQHRLWKLDDPFLYRVTVTATAKASFDEQSTRFGFRDFRFENDAFRLNGQRIYLQGALILPHFPVGFRVPPGTDYLRRDLVAAKAMGLNTIRVIWGGLCARDFDLFDEMGILVQQEHFGAHRIAAGPEMIRRFDESIGGVIRRDRNHPSIVIWTLLNESGIGGLAAEDGPVFRHAVQSLPFVKFLDNTRFVSLNSGGFDMQFGQASTSNPGATDWQFLMGAEAPGKPGYANWWQDFGAMSGNQFAIKGDMHVYPLVPYTANEIRQMRMLGQRAEGRKIVISETGSACAVNLPRFARHYEQMGAEYAEDARYYRDKLDQFMADWKKWDLGRIWTTPEDYFTDSERNMVKVRRVAGNALRSNPFLAGHYFCALVDSDFNGVGLLNNFREFKPGVVDLQTDLTAPVRWCLFAEPASIFSGGKVKLEAVLSNFDALRAGQYPVHIQVVAPDGSRVLDEKITIDIPDPKAAGEPPLVREVFSREVPVSGPAGTFKFLVGFERGAVATGGEITFNVFDPAAMPPVGREVVLWGDDPGLAQWLTNQKIRFRPFEAGSPKQRELILVGNGGGDLAAFRELAQRMVRGSAVVFLSPAVFARGDQPLAFLPLVTKGSLAAINVVGGYYRGDTFAPKHPVFDGLTSGGVLDYTLYRNIITQGGLGLAGAPAPDDLIAAGIRAQMGYASVINTAAYKFGEGRFVFNTLLIRENLGTDPVAELLLRNLLNYAARDLDKPVADLPADFEKQLKAIGYE